MPDPPQRPADPRPNDEPYYIDSACPECGTALVLYDEIAATDGPVWYDEWICPACDDGLYMDWPASYWAHLDEPLSGWHPLDTRE